MAEPFGMGIGDNKYSYMTDEFEVCERSSSSSTEIEHSKVPP